MPDLCPCLGEIVNKKCTKCGADFDFRPKGLARKRRRVRAQDEFTGIMAQKERNKRRGLLTYDSHMATQIAKQARKKI